MPREDDLPEAELDDDVDTEGADKSTELADEGDDDPGDEGEHDDGEEDNGDDDAAGADEGRQSRSDQVRGRGGRASDTIRNLKAERRADRERLQNLERELDQIRRGGQQQQQQPKETAEQRQARWALMSPAEIAAETASELRTEFQQQLFGLQFQSADRADRADFRQACRDNPALKNVADEVERVLADQRRQGINTPRETIALYLIGKRAVERAGSAGTRQRKRGEAERAQHKAKPGGGVRGRSDADRGGRQQQDDRAARRARLENVTF